MCIISLHFQDHAQYKLIIAANRDEFYERPTKEARFWDDEPELLAGRDLERMGTWLGITKQGRFAALTNYRDPTNEHPNKSSRGQIVTSFLTGGTSTPDFLKELRKRKDDYNGFNIIVGTVDELYYYGNRQTDIVKLNGGTYTVSNHLLNTPWPKVEKARTMLQNYVTTHEEIDVDALFEQLAYREIASDELLPNTGVGIDLERKLSPIFIKTDGYGTRSSTVLLINQDNEVTFIERTYNEGSFKKENKFTFRIK